MTTTCCSISCFSGLRQSRNAESDGILGMKAGSAELSECDDGKLQQLLKETRARLRDLEQETRNRGISPCVSPASKQASKKEITVFVDGAFDLMHFGHMNAFRQARALGDRLIVGVNSDATIAECKGPPVLNDAERQAAVAACRFVDDIIPCSPYVMTEDYISGLMENQGIDLFVHGDDPCIVDGKDVYAAAKAKGAYQSIPRTEGVSTTDIVGRALLLTKSHHLPDNQDSEVQLASALSPRAGGNDGHVPVSLSSKSLVTSSLYNNFLMSLPSFRTFPKKVIYIDGAWDMFHTGHIDIMKKARALGDYLIVGVHSDQVVNKHRGGNFPIMNMQERVMTVIGCRYVDDVLLDAPWNVTQEMIASLHITYVASGTVHDEGLLVEDDDPHKVPIELGIERKIRSEITLTVEDILDRVQKQRERLAKRHAEKSTKETDWYWNKHGKAQPS